MYKVQWYNVVDDEFHVAILTDVASLASLTHMLSTAHVYFNVQTVINGKFINATVANIKNLYPPRDLFTERSPMVVNNVFWLIEPIEDFVNSNCHRIKSPPRDLCRDTY